MAAAIVVCGFLLIGGVRLNATTQLFFLLGAATVAFHLALHRDGWHVRLWWLIPTALLTWAAGAGVFFLVFAAGGCDKDGHIGVVSWLGCALLFFAGSAWALQRPIRGLIGVPVSLLAGGVWLVVTATAISGGTGTCLD